MCVASMRRQGARGVPEGGAVLKLCTRSLCRRQNGPLVESGMQTIVLMLALAFAAPALAQQKSEAVRSEGVVSSYKGIWVSTPFPAFNIAAGETVTLELTVHNSGLAPQQVGLQLERMPSGWSATFLGEGKRVQAVFVAPGEKARVKLRLQPTAKAPSGSHRFEIVAAGAQSRFRLPIELTIGQAL